MLKSVLIFCVSITYFVTTAGAQVVLRGWEPDVSSDDDLISWQEKYEELTYLSEHPFNINTITKEQLEQLPFLSDAMIENILYYVYKYGPLLTKNELLGVEGMDRQTRHFLQEFIYIGQSINKQDKLLINNILRYNKQELFTRVDIPLYQKSGYAAHDAETLEKYPNRKYYGSSVYNNLRYNFNYRNQIMFGLTAEKDAGEPFFSKFNKKGYDYYGAYVLLKDIGRLKVLALGNYKASFGYGLVVNTGIFSFGKLLGTSVGTRFGKGLSKHSSTSENDYLQGGGITYRIGKRWEISAYSSFRKLDARVDNTFIMSFKKDGLHRTKGDYEKKNTVSNALIGSDLFYRGKQFKIGLTAVYNRLNKVLNPEVKPYNEYYPRGNEFFNGSVYYKYHFRKFTFSGETALDKGGRVATLNMLSYSPTVYTSFLFINRYFDKRYESLSASSSFSDNTYLQNELGWYLGMNTNMLGSKLKLSGYVDIFKFFHYKYQVDKKNSMGSDVLFQTSYSPHNKLSVLIKYGYKSRDKNYTSADKSKYVLTNNRNRISGQVVYSPFEQCVLKTGGEYVRSGFMRRQTSEGILLNGTAKFDINPIKLFVSGAWFKTDSYDSRIYMYEPGLLYSFSMQSFYGRGSRTAAGIQYNIKRYVSFQAKWGWTHYTDRDKIGTGAEEIQGSNKADIQLQLRVMW